MTRVIRKNKIGVGNTLAVVGQITPPTLTGNVDNYEPSGFGAGVLIRQDVNANNRSISGFPQPIFPDRGVFPIQNINLGSLDIRFLQNQGSLPDNTILLRDNAQKSLKPNDTAWFGYDWDKLKWTPLNRVG